MPKKVTLNDIAHRAGVSRMAVSHVLLGTAKGRISVGDEKSTRIREVANELGYVPNRPAQMMHGAKSQLIGVLYYSTHLGHRFTQLNTAMSGVAQENGYSIVTAITGFRPKLQEKAVSEFRALQVDGVLLLAQDPSLKWQGYGDLFDCIDHVAVLGPSTSKNWITQAYPFEELSNLAVDHLTESGRRNLALVLTDREHLSSAERERGFLQRVDHHGLDQNAVIVESRLWSRDEGRTVAETLMRRLRDDGVDGIIVQNDQIASTLMSGARKAGIDVPNEIGIVGLDDEPFASTLLPSLTSVNMNFREVVGQVLNRLIDSIEGRPATEEEPAQPFLVPRESTA